MTLILAFSLITKMWWNKRVSSQYPFLTIRLKKEHRLMILQTLKFHKHTTWSVYMSFLSFFVDLRYSLFSRHLK